VPSTGATVPTWLSGARGERLSAMFSDARWVSPGRAVKVCETLRRNYYARLRRLRTVPATSHCGRRSRLPEDVRQIRAALAALRHVKAILVDRETTPLRADERRLLQVAKPLCGPQAGCPQPYREMIETLVDTLEIEPEARKEAIAAAFVALLPVTAHLWRLEEALEKPLIARKGGLRRAVKIQRQHRRWRTEARRFWRVNPELPVTRVAQKLRYRFPRIMQASKTIEDAIRDLKPRK